jgi:glycosyltransferase involved in cell wall biosynthesis
MYWGAVEPVGLATAVPTVLGLAKKARITLLSFEKPEDLEKRPALELTSRRLAEVGVRWVSIPYSRGYRRTAGDILSGVRALLEVHRADPFQAIEGRTFVGGFVAALASSHVRVPFLYHTEGCWLGEQVDVGRLKPGSLTLRILRGVESWMMKQAGACVALTEAGASHLRRRHLANRPEVPVLVIPTTSVLVGTAPEMGPARAISPGEPVAAVYAGNVTGRYLLDEMLTFLGELVARRPGSVVDLLTHRDRDVAEAAVARHGLQGVVTLDSVSHYEIPARFRGRDCGLFFLDRGDSVACVSPTKIPEYLEFGIPVVCTRASGDGAAVLTQARAGVIIEDPRNPEERKRVLQSLDGLLLDTERSRRAQDMAREHYSLEAAVGSQLAALLKLADGVRG